MIGKPTVTVIENGGRNLGFLTEMWEYRELFFFLSLRDILVRYKQTAIGVLWSLLRPVISMVVFTVVFGKVAKLPSEASAPYALMVFAALLPWQLFSNALQNAGDSVVQNRQIVTKVYFPRAIIPLSAVITAVVDFLVAATVYAAMMAWYGVYPDAKVLLLPLFLGQCLLTATGLGMAVAALNVAYRDFRHILPFVVQLGLFASPVGFSSTVVPEEWRLLYSINPMVGVIDGFRYSLLGQDSVMYMPGYVASLAVTALVAWSGFWLFRRMESSFSDRI